MPESQVIPTGLSVDGGSDGFHAPTGVMAEGLDELTTLDNLPVEQHADVYERVHRRLTDAMAATDDA